MEQTMSKHPPGDAPVSPQPPPPTLQELLDQLRLLQRAERAADDCRAAAHAYLTVSARLRQAAGPAGRHPQDLRDAMAEARDALGRVLRYHGWQEAVACGAADP